MKRSKKSTPRYIAILGDARLPIPARVVAVAIDYHSDDQGHCFLDDQALAQAAGLSRAAATAARRKLWRIGLLTKTFAAPPGRWRPLPALVLSPAAEWDGLFRVFRSCPPPRRRSPANA